MDNGQNISLAFCIIFINLGLGLYTLHEADTLEKG